MARINIEDKWWTDARRNKLVELLKGNSREADGLWLQACKLAQNHCEDGTIPLSEFLCLPGSELLVECDLAVIVQANSKQTPSKAKQTIATAKEDRATLDQTQAYVRGSEANHDWLKKRREAGRKGGGKSAQRPRSKAGTLQANSKQTEANSKQTQPSYSSSYSYSSSSSSSSRDTPRPKAPAPTNAAWEAYRDAFQKRWETLPVRNATVNSQLAQILKRIPSAEIPELIRFYVKSDNPYYVKHMHKIGNLLSDAETVYAQMKGNIKIEDTRINGGGYVNGKAKQTTDLIDHNRRVKEDWLAQQKEKEKHGQHN